MAENGKSRISRWKWTNILLVVSLSINLLVVGGAVGLALKWPRHGMSNIGGFYGSGSVGFFARALGDHHKGELSRKVHRNAGEFRKYRSEGRDLVEEMIVLLGSDQFEAATLDRLLARHREILMSQIERGHEFIAEEIVAMSPDERKAFAERFDRGFKGRGHRR